MSNREGAALSGSVFFLCVTGGKSCSTFSHTTREISSSILLDLSSIEPVEFVEEVVCDSS